MALSCIVGNGDAYLKNFGLLYSNPTQRDARLAPVYDSLFASRQVLLGFAQVCEVARPEDVIREQLQALKRVLARSTELGEQAPHVVAAIR